VDPFNIENRGKNLKRSVIRQADHEGISMVDGWSEMKLEQLRSETLTSIRLKILKM
jgi:hypothetical protein